MTIMIPIDITLLGIEIDCNDVHDANALSPINRFITIPI